ncbi:MAG TPA: DUF4386 domain-containing protein, partial [Alphaproteobacteria bacterium]|nr:DUF4386 domain-containing protein [Alphaproteobacteria bacterium]
ASSYAKSKERTKPMMTSRSFLSPQLKARLAGLCYLITILVGSFDHVFVARKLIVPGDAALTAHNLLASEQLYRLAFALDMIPVYIVVTVLLYDLLKPAGNVVAKLAVFSSLLGGAVGATIAVLHLAPFSILGGTGLASAFGMPQLQGLTLLLLRMYDDGFTISLVFYGFYCFLIGCLIIASTFLPRLVGLLMAIGGAAYMTYSFAAFLSPQIGSSLAPYALGLGGLGELALTLWLLLAGVSAEKWNAQAAFSA